MSSTDRFEEEFRGIVCRVRDTLLPALIGTPCERRTLALLFIGRAANEGEESGF